MEFVKAEPICRKGLCAWASYYLLQWHLAIPEADAHAAQFEHHRDWNEFMICFKGSCFHLGMNWTFAVILRMSFKVCPPQDGLLVHASSISQHQQTAGFAELSGCIRQMVAGWYATCAARSGRGVKPPKSQGQRQHVPVRTRLCAADWYHILFRADFPKDLWVGSGRQTEPPELQECVTCLRNSQACSPRLASKTRCHMWHGHLDWLTHGLWHIGTIYPAPPIDSVEPEQYLGHQACTACAHQALRFVMVMFMVAFKFDLAAAWSWWTEKTNHSNS